MHIITKFNINDEVWFIHTLSKIPVCGRIKEINIQVGGKPKYIHGEKRNLIKTGEYEEKRFVHTYIIDDQIRKEGLIQYEYDLFTTKDELKNELKRKAELL